MTKLTRHLREEHRALLPEVETLRKAADSVGWISMRTLREEVDEALEFLLHRLIPHADAEDQLLYPAVARVLGAPEATATMSRDHVEVGRLTEELAALRSGLDEAILHTRQEDALRRVLYGLYALVRVHFAKEEEVYLPLLERLPDREAAEILTALEREAGHLHTATA